MKLENILSKLFRGKFVPASNYDNLRRKYALSQNVNKLVGSISNQYDILWGVLDLIQKETNADSSSLLLRQNDDGKNLYFEIVRGELASPNIRDITISVGEGIIGIVAGTARSYLTNDAQNDPNHNKQIDKLTNYYPQAILACPIIHTGEVTGVVELLKTKGAFKVEDRELLDEVISYQVGQ